MQKAIGRIRDAYGKRVEQKTTEQAIRQLQAVVQKLADKVENKVYETARPSLYAAAAAGKASYQTRS